MSDISWDKFFDQRSKSLWDRFPGMYRSLVVETNDPLCMMRIRFKCPDIHDSSLAPNDCPWAVPSFDFGGSKAGRFSHPCIGDWVWISFEKQHPYGPVWVGFANPTRRKLYSLPQIHQQTPLSLNSSGKPNDKPNDYDSQYLPKDGRPMAHGWQDRYGNLDIHSSVGFFPKEHSVAPPAPDNDAISGAAFKQQSSAPEVNKPDNKHMSRVTKYGMMFVMSDQGYHWKKEGDFGEFSGDFESDEQYEISRWKSVQKLISDTTPNKDSRRMIMMTRYGSRIEMRDTGWAQLGPKPSKSRSDEFGPKQILSKEETNDFRWIKIRTKGGMLWQAYDKGFDPEEDEFIKRKLDEEQGASSEEEDKHWAGKDARWIRTVTRYGYKIVLDDRGSDPKDASKKENPIGNGILIKGRRSPSANAKVAEGDQRGFYWEFNENDKANHTMWGSPNGLTIEMNDRYQYMMMSASLGKEWASKWQGLKENEFIRKPTMMENPETSSHHIKLDHANEYIRLKTRAGKGSTPIDSKIVSGVSGDEIHQGLEARDGDGADGPWVEIVDCQHRGMWFSKKNNIGIWRSKDGIMMYQWFDESTNSIVIYNNQSSGKIQIYSAGGVEINSNSTVAINSGGDVTMKAAGKIMMQAGETKFTIGDEVKTNTKISAKKMAAYFEGVKAGDGAGDESSGGDQVDDLVIPTLPEMVEPTDRGQTYNGPFEECPIKEVEHKDGE